MTTILLTESNPSGVAVTVDFVDSVDFVRHSPSLKLMETLERATTDGSFPQSRL
jgi:hypothetical protein